MYFFITKNKASNHQTACFSYYLFFKTLDFTAFSPLIFYKQQIEYITSLFYNHIFPIYTFYLNLYP